MGKGRDRRRQMEHISPGGSRFYGPETSRQGILVTDKRGVGYQPDSPASPSKETTWRCGALTGCPLEKLESKPDIVLASSLYYALVDLARYVDTEWFGYMTGKIEGRTATLDDVFFPKQRASGAHCEPLKDERPPEGTIAAVHSHVKMNAFFSKTDDDHANWPIELVLNARGDIAGRMRVQLKCGEYELCDARVLLSGTALSEQYRPQLQEALEKGKAAATPATLTVPTFGACPVCEKHHAPHCQMVCAKCGSPAHKPGEICSASVGGIKRGNEVLEWCSRCRSWHPKSDPCDPTDAAYYGAWGE